MTDQNFHEELRATIREAVASYLDTCTDEELRELATESLLPPTPLPTLADMTEEERAECQWMLADVNSPQVGDSPCVIINITDTGVMLYDQEGLDYWRSHNEVTPRPDLPHMKWPGDQETAPAPALPDGWRLADHKLYGRVIVTSTSTSPNGDGYVYILLSTTESKGYDWVFCPVNRLTFLDTDQEAGQ